MHIQRDLPADGRTRLLRGADPLKDQSYFLASVPQEALARCAFPLGGLRKADVRTAAAAARLPTAAKRSSAGICFIGATSQTFICPTSHLDDSASGTIAQRHVVSQQWLRLSRGNMYCVGGHGLLRQSTNGLGCATAAAGVPACDASFDQPSCCRWHTHT